VRALRITGSSGSNDRNRLYLVVSHNELLKPIKITIVRWINIQNLLNGGEYCQIHIPYRNTPYAEIIHHIRHVQQVCHHQASRESPLTMQRLIP
jgi:hypothetical protein